MKKICVVYVPREARRPLRENKKEGFARREYSILGGPETGSRKSKDKYRSW